MQLRYPPQLLDDEYQRRDISLSEAERMTAHALVNTLFFASLKLEESEPVRIAIVHKKNGAEGLEKELDCSPEGEEEPERAWEITRLNRRNFDPSTLAKLSPGLRYGTHIVVVGGEGPDLWIDGVARRNRRTDGGSVTRIAAPRPGVLVFERRNEEILRFEAGRSVPPAIDVLGTNGLVRTAVGAITGEPGTSSHGYSLSEAPLVRLIRETRATGHGAILALLPTQPDDQELARIKYRRLEVGRLAQRLEEDRKAFFEWIGAVFKTVDQPSVEQTEARLTESKRAARELAREALDAAVDDVARTSAIDGAVLIGPKLQVYGAGYIAPLKAIPVAPLRALDPMMQTTEPFPDAYGARHTAAFSLAYHAPGAVVFVVSEDGPVNCALRVGEQLVVWPVRVSET